MFTDHLEFNVLNFRHALVHLNVQIGQQETVDSFRLSLSDCKSLSSDFDGAEELYCVFDKDAENTKQISRPLSVNHLASHERAWSFSFLKKYYTRMLTHHFRDKGFVCSNNFVSDTEVWIPSESVYPNCKGYRAFTLRVQFNQRDYQPELLVAMGELKSVFTKALDHPNFSEIQQELFTKVLYNNTLYSYKYLPDTVRRHLDETYPCVNFELLRALKYVLPAPEKGNRYLKYHAAIETFRVNFLEDSALETLFFLDKKWKTSKVEKLDTHLITHLKFGEGFHTDPMKGMREFGPKELVRDETVFFYILHQDHKPVAIAIDDYLRGNNDEFKGGLNGFLHMKYTTENNMSINFSDRNNPLPEIKLKLEDRKFDPSKRYVAIYLSPHSKWTRDKQLKLIYYQLKEMLLDYGVVSQTLEVDKFVVKDKIAVNNKGVNMAVLQPNFKYSLPNIFVAISAKLGATPWCFEEQTNHELVIGISAYRSRDLDGNYLGSAFSFTNEGQFQGFNCFRSNKLIELAGSIALAVREFQNKNKEAKRLVIHFYKRLSWKELQPIEKALANLGLKIPVVVVSVNKSYSDDIVGFDNTKEHKMPISGTFISLLDGQYLVYNNQLQTGLETVKERAGFPFPLKINIQKFSCGSDENETLSKEEEQQLLLQVCRFSQLYWKSVSRQWLPVTLRYPEMLAQIVPHFKHNDIPEIGRSSLWFL